MPQVTFEYPHFGVFPVDPVFLPRRCSEYGRFRTAPRVNVRSRFQQSSKSCSAAPAPLRLALRSSQPT
jgi:hypothetical protein